MKIVGRREGLSTSVWVDEKRLTHVDLKRSLALRNHSPTGFEWGYAGSGPAQLSIAILQKAGFSNERVERLYQRFKNAFIASANRNGFEIEVDIEAWADATDTKH